MSIARRVVPDVPYSTSFVTMVSAAGGGKASGGASAFWPANASALEAMRRHGERARMVQHERESTPPRAAVGTESDREPHSEDRRHDSGDGLTGKLERIWLKRAKAGPMDPMSAALLEVGGGLRGNANRGGKRQVTIISQERWTELMTALGAEVPPRVRRANLMVSGLNLENSRGRVLRVGSTRLQINGETRPCEQMEAAHAGLQALMRERWGGGAFAAVIEGGAIRVGDDVQWVESSPVTDSEQSATSDLGASTK